MLIWCCFPKYELVCLFVCAGWISVGQMAIGIAVSAALTVMEAISIVVVNGWSKTVNEQSAGQIQSFWECNTTHIDTLVIVV